MVVFADTFYFLALLDQRDEHHKRVLRFAASYREEFVTTRWVLAEVANALGGSPIRAATVRFLQRLEHDASFHIIGDNDSLYERGFALYASRLDKEWSLTDCVSFVVMKDEEIEDALTRDHHFNQAGFKPLFAD